MIMCFLVPIPLFFSYTNRKNKGVSNKNKIINFHVQLKYIGVCFFTRIIVLDVFLPVSARYF